MRTEKFISLFKFATKSKVKAGDGLTEGIFPFYTSSSVLKLRINKAQHFDQALIFGTGGSASIHFSNEPFATSTDCLVATNLSDTLNTKYVYYYLSSNLHLLERGFKGAGLKHISKKYIEDIEIPILPIFTQNKIVDVLDRVNLIITKREEIINIFDELIRSIFWNMFGDPYFNSHKFPIDTLENLCDFITKGTTPKKDEIYLEPFQNSVPYLKAYHISDNGDMNISYKPCYISLDIHQNKLKRSKVFPNDILMNIVGPPLGKIGIVPSDFKEYNVNQAIAIFRTKELITPIYLLHALRSKTLVQSIIDQAVGVRQLNLSLNQCRNIKIPIPPIELQKEFKKIIDKYSSIITDNLHFLNQVDTLKNSVSQKVFNGQLNFDVDFELDALIHKIDLDKKENDLSKISGDVAYLQRIVDKLNDQEFTEKDLYDKAKHGIFQLMTADEKDRKVIQVYDENSQSLKLALK